MTETGEAEKNEVMRFDARIRGEEEIRPWTGFLWRWLRGLVAFLPSYRQTRKGRAKRKQLQIIFLVLGIGLMILGGQAQTAGGLWIIVGVALASVAFAVPVEEMKKRSWRTKLKHKQSPRKRLVWHPGSVVHDGQRVALNKESTKLRHVRIDRGKHELAIRLRDGVPCLGILPPGAKKKESIWICTSGPVGEVPESEGSIEHSDMDCPAEVSAHDWERLWNAMGKRY